MNLLKRFFDYLDRVAASRPCSICGSPDCKRKNREPWHPAPGPELKNPPRGGISVVSPKKVGGITDSFKKSRLAVFDKYGLTELLMRYVNGQLDCLYFVRGQGSCDITDPIYEGASERCFWVDADGVLIKNKHGEVVTVDVNIIYVLLMGMGVEVKLKEYCSCSPPWEGE